MAQARRTFFSLGGPTYLDDPRESEARAREASQRAQQAVGLQRQQIQNELMLGQQRLALERDKLPDRSLEPQRLAMERRRLEHEMAMDPLRFELEREKLASGDMKEREMALKERRGAAEIEDAAARLGLSEQKLVDALSMFTQGQAQTKALSATSDALRALLQTQAETATAGRQKTGIEAGTAGRAQTIEGQAGLTTQRAGLGEEAAVAAAGRQEARDKDVRAQQELMAKLNADQRIKVAEYVDILTGAREETAFEHKAGEAKLDRGARLGLVETELKARTGEAKLDRGARKDLVVTQLEAAAAEKERGRVASRKAKSVDRVFRGTQRGLDRRARAEEGRQSFMRGEEGQLRQQRYADVVREDVQAFEKELATGREQATLRIAILGTTNAKERLELEKEKFTEDKRQFGVKHAQAVKAWQSKYRLERTQKEAETEQWALERVGEFRKLVHSGAEKTEVAAAARLLLAKVAAADKSLGNVDAKGRPIASGIYAFTKRQIQEQAGKKLMERAEPGAWEKTAGVPWPLRLPGAVYEEFWRSKQDFPSGRRRALQTGDEQLLESLSGQEETFTPGTQDLTPEELRRFRARQRRR